MRAGFKYLLTYLVSQGESVSSIVDIFGIDEQNILEANELSATSIIFYFTPISVPLKTEPPVGIQRATTPPEDSPLPPPRPAPAEDRDSDSSKKWVIVGIVVGVVVLLILSAALFLLRFYQLRQVEHPSLPPPKAFSGSATMKATIPMMHSWSVSSEGVRYAIKSLSVFEFEELQKATGFFGEENKIKGSVYRASFKGDYAAVEVLKGDTYLVYRFAENDSLEDWLHSVNKKYENSVPLSWVQRVHIAHDVADALNYLHNYTSPPHVHKNLKSGSVLLDRNFRAKFSNFGLARAVEDQGGDGGIQLTKHVVGTQGYMPPEYIENCLITPKMDVFAFWGVLLELLSGNVKEKLGGFMDPDLRYEYPLELAYSMAEHAKRCVARPQISEVFMILSNIQYSTLDWDPSDELEWSRSVSQISDRR
ncbi:hypothetical protein AAZX31_15G200700 [Glycine max]